MIWARGQQQSFHQGKTGRSHPSGRVGSGNPARGAVQQWTVARWLPLGGGRWVCPCPVALDSRQKSPERIVGEREPSVPVLRNKFPDGGTQQVVESGFAPRVEQARGVTGGCCATTRNVWKMWKMLTDVVKDVTNMCERRERCWICFKEIKHLYFF